jgi:hypothetical protein
VQIAQVGQLFQHSVFDEYTDAMVDLDTSTRLYRYLIGMETLYKNAAVLRDALRRQGFDDAFVVPYFEGRRITAQEVPHYAERFPDLLNVVE